MIGIVVVAHGNLATSLINTVQIFVGESKNVVSVDLLPDAGPETFVDNLRDAAAGLDEGNGLLILADLFGGTPGNSALKIISENDNWECVTGVNLTMLLEAVLNRNNYHSAKELAEVVLTSGTAGIQKLSTVLTQAKQTK